jgi:RHS repeat-associated protein
VNELCPITVDGVMIGQLFGGVRTDYLVDYLGSVTGETYANGDAGEDSRYKPYGGLQSGQQPHDFGWTGNTGSVFTRIVHAQQYNRARHYASSLRRWTTRDPMWPEESPYAYVNGNPVRWIDPSGYSGCDVPCCCEPKLLIPWGVRVLRNATGPLSGQPNREGHLFNLWFKTESEDDQTQTGGDCSLHWWECSNFELYKGAPAGVWLDRTRDLQKAKGFGEWFSRGWNCKTKRLTSGMIQDEPSLNTDRLKDRKTVTARALWIRAFIKSGGGDVATVRLSLICINSSASTSLSLAA